MSIKLIKIKNLLSFDKLEINELQDINCIVGKNNVGKSNLLKLISFFYNKLENKRELPPALNSKYSSAGSISICYDISHISRIVQAKKNKSNHNLPYFKEVFNLLVNPSNKKSIEIVLTIHSNESISWNIKDTKLLKIISDLYPFFSIETRHINLHDWNNIWFLISRLKPFNPHKVKQQKIIDFFEKEVSGSKDIKYNNYGNYITNIEDSLETAVYNYKEKVLSFVKTGLRGQSFLIDEKQLETESDGLNSYTFVKSFLLLLVSLTRKSYITPILYIDEPETGLHPKKNEELINDLYDVVEDYSQYKTPMPQIIFSTHSPNIVKEVIKLFDNNQQILHFSKDKSNNTSVKKMNSTYSDKRFLHIFSDNEARLFFSNFILFVEGETEIEIFTNKALLKKFPILKEIDVYKSSSNVLGAHVNPDYSNTAIPYIFLFDADKIYTFTDDQTDTNLKKIKLLNSNPELYILPDGKIKKYDEKFNDLILKYQKGFNQIYRDTVNNLQNIKDIKDEKFTFDNGNFRVKDFNKYTKLVQYLKIYLLNKNVLFLHTTIEEALIHEKSEGLFFTWMEDENNLIIDDFLYEKREVNYSFSLYKNRKSIGETVLFNSRKVINKKIIYKKLKHSEYVLNFLIDYIRVMYFHGKFELLNNQILNNSSSLIHEVSKKQINEFKKMKISCYKKLKSFGIKKDKQIEQLEITFDAYLEVSNSTKDLNSHINDSINKFPLSKQSKTSGWATNFLSFAISEIDNNLEENEPQKREKEFRKEFSKNFGELYGIITAIENKL